MSRAAGNRLVQWASNPEFRGRRVRQMQIRALTDEMVKQYAPEGVMEADFTEEMDGDQQIIFYYRDLYTCVIDLLQHPRFKARQYTRFSLVKDKDGHRVYGAFNTGEWYRIAQLRSNGTAPGDASIPVSPVPVFLSSDVTVARKSIQVWPIYCWCPFPRFCSSGSGC